MSLSKLEADFGPAAGNDALMCAHSQRMPGVQRSLKCCCLAAPLFLAEDLTHTRLLCSIYGSGVNELLFTPVTVPVSSAERLWALRRRWRETRVRADGGMKSSR